MKLLQYLTSILIISATLWNLASCTPNWHKASDGTKYLIETEYKYNWFAASHECERRSSQLVVIDSQKKNFALIDLLKKTVGKSLNLWIGANDEFNTKSDKKRPFYWSSTGQRFSYTFWAETQPDNYQNNQHCVSIWDRSSAYKWDDGWCTSQYGYICEENHYLQIYRKNLEDKRVAVKKLIDQISQLKQKHFADNIKTKQNEIDKVLRN